MASFQNYIFPESLEDAYKLLQANRRNAVIGGNGWPADKTLEGWQVCCGEPQALVSRPAAVIFYTAA